MKETDVIAWQKVLSDLSLECIRARFSDSNQVPPLNQQGFRRISNPLNWPTISERGIQPRSEPFAKPLALEIPEDLHSVQTLQFLGFQRTSAEEIFADFTSPENRDSNLLLGFANLAKEYLTAAEVIAEQFTEREGPPMEDITKFRTLAHKFMGFDLQGGRLDEIDEPERPLHPSTVRYWFMDTLERRYEFLCKLDSRVREMEKFCRRLEDEEAKRKARNRKKAEAKKAVKQRRKALKDGGADKGRVDGDDDGRLKYLLAQVQLADDAEEKEGEAQASKDAKGAPNPPKISTL